MTITFADPVEGTEEGCGRGSMVLGISAKPASDRLVPRLVGVALRKEGDGIEVVETFAFRCEGTDRASQITSLSSQLGEWLSASDVSVAAVKGPSVMSPVSRQAVAMMRAQMEGAAVASLELQGVETVMWGDANSLARRSGSLKSDVQRFALTFPTGLQDAAFAALTSLPTAIIRSVVPPRRVRIAGDSDWMALHG